MKTRDAIGCWPIGVDMGYEWPLPLENDYVYWHKPIGCTNADTWFQGCWGCKEQYDACDLIVPCKRKSESDCDDE